MISIIICSRNSTLSSQLSENLKETTGVEYELIIIDNPTQKYSIFSAYNEGVKKAKFPILCFLHDDIQIRTNNWGKKAIHYLNNENIGLLGVAGTPFYPKLPSSWWGSGIVSGNITHLINGLEENQKVSYFQDQTIPNKVSLIDGVWFCMPKKIFNTVMFDEVNFSGYHFYDLDISMQVQKSGYSLVTVFDIDIVHFSKGKTNKDWLDSSFIFYKKWKNDLPVMQFLNLTSKEAETTTRKCFEDIFYLIMDLKLPKEYLYRLLYYYLLTDYSVVFTKYFLSTIKSIQKYQYN